MDNIPDGVQEEQAPTRREFLTRSGAALGAVGAGILLSNTPAFAERSRRVTRQAARKGGSVTMGVVGDLANFDAFNLLQVNYAYMENVYDS